MLKRICSYKIVIYKRKSKAVIFITKDIVKSSYTVSAGILVQIARYLTFLNADIEDFLRSVDIEPVIMESPDERISVEKYINIEDEAARITNDPYFGLHMGQFVEAGNWSILGYMMMNCKTLGEAFGKFAKYSNILGNLIKEDIHTESGISIYLTVPQNAPVISRHCYEGYLSSIICIARTLSGRNVNPVEVGLMFEEP
ncbi:MAG: AraC family transcriptional regulator, partial [Bacillota bacterium]|nr:AraC family transcriptional regulator [Bacillota bacterium]